MYMLYMQQRDRAPVADKSDDDFHADVYTISKSIAEGANAFLRQEYEILAIFTTVFAVLLLIILGAVTGNWHSGALSAVAFAIGSLTSIICGFKNRIN